MSGYSKKPDTNGRYTPHSGSNFFEDYIFETAILIKETKRLNKTAHQKPSTVNPGTI